MGKILTYILITESTKVNIKTTNPHCSVWPTVIDVKKPETCTVSDYFCHT